MTPGRRSSPDAVTLHIGLTNTGTGYLRHILRANRAALRAHGMEFPGETNERSQGNAVRDLQGRRSRGGVDGPIAGAWSAMVEAVERSGRPRVLLSEDRLSLCTAAQVHRVSESFPDSDMRVVVTVRDLARVVVSAWQDEVASDSSWTWREFAESVRGSAGPAGNPGRAFWRRQDVAQICQTWETCVPVDRITIVTVPRSPASPDLLLARFAEAAGFDDETLIESPDWTNETLGVAATELLRRFNLQLDGALGPRQRDAVVRSTLIPLLAQSADPVRSALSDEDMGWVSERADSLISRLAERGYRVVGDLDELRPVSKAGRRPDDATNQELLESGLDSLAALAERFATLWWQRRRPDQSVDRHRDVASGARGLVFRSQRRVADLADRNSAAARAMGAVLRARDRLRARSR